MVRLIRSSINEVRDNWQFFVTGIGEVIDRCGLDFHPADVYREITDEKAVLFWIEQDGETVGMTVARSLREMYSRKAILNLDMTYLAPHSDALEEFRDEVDELAKEFDIDRIEWQSPRKGWARTMNRIGYSAGAGCYYREVGNG